MVRRHAVGGALRTSQAGDEPTGRLRRAGHVTGAGRGGARRRPRRPRGDGPSDAWPTPSSPTRRSATTPLRCVRASGSTSASTASSSTGFTYACGVSTTFAREHELQLAPAPHDRPAEGSAWSAVGRAAPSSPRSVPSRVTPCSCGSDGTRSAGPLADRGVGPGNAKYRRWIEWQTDRLHRVGVDVHFGRTATADDILAAGADRCAHRHWRDPARPADPRRRCITRVHRRRRAERRRRSSASGSSVISEDDGPAPLVGVRSSRRARPRRHARLPDHRPVAARRQVLQRRDAWRG